MKEFLFHFSNNYALQYILPISAMVIVGLYYVLQRSSIRELMGPRALLFARGFLMAPLLIVAVLSVENYRATDYYRFNSYLNAYEFYHYYIGTKYAHELSYNHMYAATLVADSETGMKWKHSSGTIRDLESGRHRNHKTFLDNAETYKAMFTPERWEEFKKDIVWFKGKLAQGRWDGILRDKGYNGTPVWSMLVGGLLSNRISTDNERGMMFLALLDPLLILIAFLMVMWAFGPRTALFMIILLGCHYMMKWWHMKGAYLRTDWAMCLVMTVCLIKKERFVGAGMLTAYAVLSRIFPAVLLFGLGAKFFWAIIEYALKELRALHERLNIKERPPKDRRIFYATEIVFAITLIWGTYGFVTSTIIPFMAMEAKGVRPFFDQLVSGAQGVSPFLNLFTLLAWTVIGMGLGALTLYGLWYKYLERRYLYFFVSFATTVVILVGISSLYWWRTDYWQDYREKIGRHSQEISTWRVGYKYIFIAEFEDKYYLEKPIKEWQPRSRSARYNELREEWWRTQFFILALALIASIGLKDYRAYILGFAPMFFLVSPTYYYYIMLLVPLLFFAPRIEHGRYALGLCMLYVTGMSGFVFYDMWRQEYGTYYWLSVQVMIMVLYMLILAYCESIAYLHGLRTAAPTLVDQDPELS